ncbi:MAG: apolipoprotein N-acyltransferase [Phycisphaeraceae bacterium]
MDESNASTQVRRYGVRSVWAHLAMCAATAVMLTLAFPLPGWSFMAYVALVPVGVLAMRTHRLRTLAWTSYLVFVAWWVLRTLWLKDVHLVAPFAVAFVCAAWFSLALVGLAAVQRRFRGAMTITLPVFWCVQEFVRTNFPLGGFAWFTLGSSQAAWREGESPGLVVQSADLFGWITVSFLVAMTSGLIVDLIARPLTKRLSTGPIRPRRTIVVAALLWAGCMTAALIYGGQRVANTPAADDPGARKVVVGIIQTNVPQSNKREGSDEDIVQRRRNDFETLIDLSTISAGDDPRPDLLVWPETMVTRPVNDEAWALAQAGRLNEGATAEITTFREGIVRLVETQGVPVVVGNQSWGFPTHERTMNSALLVKPGEPSFQRYSKMHRVPLGEYIPGPEWLRKIFQKYISPYGEDHDYTVQPGEGVVIFEVDAADGGGSPGPTPVRFAAPICYEDAIAGQCRKMVYASDGTKRADLLVNLTNDGWYAGSHQGYQHVQIAALRCIENRVPMARSVNTGVSGLIDSAGRVGPLVSVAGEHQLVAGHVNAVAVLDERATFYGRVREGFSVGLCAVAGLLLLGVFVPGGTKRRERGG